MGKTALISVSDKSGLDTFARQLVEKHGYRLLSTGGSCRYLREAGIAVTEISEYTGFPEMMDGRLKTLHPKVHGGILARRDLEDHQKVAREHGIEMIDLVVINFYPFIDTVAKEDVTKEEAIENIDIGGPAMVRSAAKNHAHVTVVLDPADYDRILDAMDDPDSLGALRRELAEKAFATTAAYDGAIAGFLSGGSRLLPGRLHFSFSKAQELRYGENPHQRAALYGDFQRFYRQHQGKELSYNNILDITAASRLIEEFERPVVAILKHTNPCGVACADRLADAWELAFATDRQAPFGGIIATNRRADVDLAEAVKDLFCEVVIAPGFSPEAIAVLARKKNLRLMEQRRPLALDLTPEIKGVAGGILVQDVDRFPVDQDAFKVVTERQPTDEEWSALIFGWKVVRNVKSNAIVYSSGERTLGIGAGQMSRIDSSRLAVRKAEEAGLSLQGSAVCSDAFFPFPDGLLAAADAGSTCAIQPGGAVRDAEVIEAANSRNMTMVFTAIRHFRHG